MGSSIEDYGTMTLNEYLDEQGEENNGWCSADVAYYSEHVIFYSVLRVERDKDGITALCDMNTSPSDFGNEGERTLDDIAVAAYEVLRNLGWDVAPFSGEELYCSMDLTDVQEL